MIMQRFINCMVGLFLLLMIVCLMLLAFKVSGLTTFFKPQGYNIAADFDDIGSLKVRAPVKISGVVVGEVTDISLNPSNFKAKVSIRINAEYNIIPDDSSLSILTAGLLGDNYLAITPMYNQTFLKNGSVIAETHPAMILEKLIGQLVYKIGNSGGTNKTTATEPNTAATTHDDTHSPTTSGG